MADFHILIWALSLLFCMAMGFVVLLWCRSWRREEREATDRSLEALSREVSRLAVTVDGMDETAASLLAADEQLARDIERLREQVRLLKSAAASAVRSSKSSPPAAPAPSKVPDDVTPVDRESTPDLPETADAPPSGDRFENARQLLQQGLTDVEVARKLKMGAAEVRMIARMMESESAPKNDS